MKKVLAITAIAAMMSATAFASTSAPVPELGQDINAYEKYAIEQTEDEVARVITMDNNVVLRAAASTGEIMEIDYEEPGSEYGGVAIGSEFGFEKSMGVHISSWSHSDKVYHMFRQHDGSMTRYATANGRVIGISRISPKAD